MCGVVGIVAHGPVNQALYDGLSMLQHRGQDAAGMVTEHEGRFISHKGIGLVGQVFRTGDMINLGGNMGIGHVRYPTTGSRDASEIQPMYVNSPHGIALGHNGQLVNADSLVAELHTRSRHINSASDSEILLNVLADELQRHCRAHPTPRKIFNAVRTVHERCRGGYAVTAMIAGSGLLAFRDPDGIRPLALGRRQSALGDEYIVASESVAITALGFELMRDLHPGEIIFIDNKCRRLQNDLPHPPRKASPCLFEFVYLARPDSTIDGISVYEARLRMGETLAEMLRQEWPDHDIDAVIPVPDTGRTAALPLAVALGIEYREGFVKNRYSTRTFIMPGQVVRQRSVRQKLNAIEQEFRDKNVLLVDDSIVRGTTSREIIQMARHSGANKVYFAAAAPPVRHPNYYGIDIAAGDALVASSRDEQQAAEFIGADRLFYQKLEPMCEAMRRGHDSVAGFEASCFSGDYIAGSPGSAKIQAVQGDIA